MIIKNDEQVDTNKHLNEINDDTNKQVNEIRKTMQNIKEQ
jgi:hypothetical protein